MALAWIYALLLVPVVFAWWNFEVMVTFTLLLSLWWLVRYRLDAADVDLPEPQPEGAP